MKPLIIAWPGQDALAAALASALDAEASILTLRQFPDGESYVRLPVDPAGRHVVFACGLEKPDAKCTGLCFAAATARELGARNIGLVAPYLAYMRQDARFHAGEAIASRLFARWLSATVDWLATVDPHLHRHAALDEIYSIPTAVASSVASIAEWISANVIDPLVVGPDAESAQWAAAVAAAVGCPNIVLGKTRHGDRDVEIHLPSMARWQRRTPVLVDDIISTARTMAMTIRQLVSVGMPAPVCVGVHALFSGDALATLESAGAARIVTCNSVAHPTNAIDVLDAVAVAARGLLDARDDEGAAAGRNQAERSDG
jgi:ribose-phosphate pyrophosphokinase